MSFNFKQSAEKITTISKLMEGRTKAKTREIIDKFPDGITITGFDLVNGAKGQYPVLIFKEDDTKFFNGGLVFTKIVNEWLSAYDGDIAKCNKDLLDFGGVAVKMEIGTTKSGNNITKVTIL